MTRHVVRALVVMLLAVATPAMAHSGPPYPIVTDRVLGRYLVSVWTDPDTTDDGSPGGQFWVTLACATGEAIPALTRATVAIRPLDRPGPERRATAEPVRGDVGNQFAGLVLDHEGRFAVRVAIAGPLGPATTGAEVAATYDLRPPLYMLAVYLMPFVLVSLLWGRMLLRRRRRP